MERAQSVNAGLLEILTGVMPIQGNPPNSTLIFEVELLRNENRIGIRAISCGTRFPDHWFRRRRWPRNKFRPAREAMENETALRRQKIL
jgi:hypothetical protein